MSNFDSKEAHAVKRRKARFGGLERLAQPGGPGGLEPVTRLLWEQYLERQKTYHAARGRKKLVGFIDFIFNELKTIELENPDYDWDTVLYPYICQRCKQIQKVRTRSSSGAYDKQPNMLLLHRIVNEATQAKLKGAPKHIKNPDKVCTHCGGVGHTAAQCFQKRMQAKAARKAKTAEQEDKKPEPKKAAAKSKKEDAGSN